MKRTLYHGTTLENWERIQAEGWNGQSRKGVWDCSDEEGVYFYDLGKSDTDKEYAESSCIQYAFESACIAASVHGYNQHALVVIKVEIDEDYVEDDYSCANMAHIASVVESENLKADNIKAVYRGDGYYPSLRLLYTAHFIADNPHLIKDHFSDLEISISKQLRDVYLDEMFEFGWHEVT